MGYVSITDWEFFGIAQQTGFYQGIIFGIVAGVVITLSAIAVWRMLECRKIAKKL